MSEKQSKAEASPKLQEQHEENPDEGLQQEVQGQETGSITEVVRSIESVCSEYVQKHIERYEAKRREEEKLYSTQESRKQASDMLKQVNEVQYLMGHLSVVAKIFDDGDEALKQQELKRRDHELETIRKIEARTYDKAASTPSPLHKLNESNKQKHLFFVDRVFGYLLTFYGIECPRHALQEVENIYKNPMGRAVLGISMMYRDHWRKTFENIQKRLCTYENFVAYCCMIPVEKYGPYFYSVLQRIAVIFEMALFCYENKQDCFEVAINCASHYFDTEFFKDAGNWPKLQTAANIVYTLTLPLFNALACDKGEASSFSDVIHHLTENQLLNERRKTLFRDLNEKFKTHSVKGIDVSGVKADERRILMKYFRDCYPGDCRESFHELSEGKDYVIDLESWLCDAPKNREMEENAEVEKIMREAGLEDETKSTCTGKQSQRKGRRTSGLAEAQSLETKVPGRETGAIPKRRHKKKEDKKEPEDLGYFAIETDHVEELQELYEEVLPSFLKTHFHNYFIPNIKDKVCLFSYEKDCFLLPERVLKDRERREQEKRLRQKRLWGVSPQGFECALPVEIERKLDSYIGSKQYRATSTGTGGEILYLAGRQDITFEKAKKDELLWVIKCYLDEIPELMTEERTAIDKFRKFKKKKHSGSRKKDDHESVLKCRMVGEVAMSSVPSESSSAKKRSRQKKKSKK